MDKNVERTLRQRQEYGNCIICDAELDNNLIPTIILQHQMLGNVMICEKHIRIQGKES